MSTRVSADIPTRVKQAGKTTRFLVISPTTSQVKAIHSKIIFTCGISSHENLLSEHVPEFRWIDPHGRVVTDSKGRYEHLLLSSFARCVSLSVTRLRCAKTAERIEILLKVETDEPSIRWESLTPDPLRRRVSMRSLQNYFGLSLIYMSDVVVGASELQILIAMSILLLEYLLINSSFHLLQRRICPSFLAPICRLYQAS